LSIRIRRTSPAVVESVSRRSVGSAPLLCPQTQEIRSGPAAQASRGARRFQFTEATLRSLDKSAFRVALDHCAQSLRRHASAFVDRSTLWMRYEFLAARLAAGNLNVGSQKTKRWDVNAARLRPLEKWRSRLSGAITHPRSAQERTCRPESRCEGATRAALGRRSRTQSASTRCATLRRQETR